MDVIEIANISGITIALLIQCIIASLALHKMARHCKAVHRQYLQFFGSLSFALTTTICQLLRAIPVYDSLSDMYTNIIFVCNLLFHLSLLSTLVLRLHKTFSKSTYEMSKVVYWGFIAMFLVEIALIIAVMLTGYVVIGLAFYGLYIIGSILAVTFFVRSLSQLARCRAMTLRESVVTPDDIHLDSAQQKLVNLAAKYVLLFILAILSTISALIIYIMVPDLVSAVAALDFCVNLLCLHLQFHFATKQYHSLCGFLDKQCNKAVTGRTKKAIAKDSSISKALSTQLGLGEHSPRSPSSASVQSTSTANLSD